MLLTARSLAIDALRRRVLESRSLQSVGMQPEDDPEPLPGRAGGGRRPLGPCATGDGGPLARATLGAGARLLRRPDHGRGGSARGDPSGDREVADPSGPVASAGRDGEGVRTMTCDQIRELLPEHLLGSLEGSEDLEVRRHLRGCVACRDERMKLEEGVSALSRAVHDQEPPPELRDRVLGTLSEEWEESGRAPATPLPLRWVRPRALAVASLRGRRRSDLGRRLDRLSASPKGTAPPWPRPTRRATGTSSRCSRSGRSSGSESSDRPRDPRCRGRR